MESATQLGEGRRWPRGLCCLQKMGGWAGRVGWCVNRTRQDTRISERIDYIYLIAFALEAATDPAGR